MQTILGAGGAIGNELAKELTNYTTRIRLFARHPKKVNDTDELMSGDLLDVKAVAAAVAGSEVVYLVAGLPYKLKVWRKQWPRIMQMVIAACEQNKSKLVFFDNIYMYDAGSIGHMTEESNIHPPSKKGRVRAEIADMLMNEVRSGKLKGMIVRSADFYGRGVKTSMIMETVYKNFLKNKKANWLGRAEKIHSFTYVPDAAKATALLGNTPDAYDQVWHLPTSSEKLNGKDWVGLFAREMNVHPAYFQVSKGLVRLMGIFMPLMREVVEMMYQNNQDYFFSSAKFEKRFPDFKITSYEEGVKAIVGTS